MRCPLDYQQGAFSSLIVSTYAPIEYINEASRAPSLRRPGGSGKPSAALIVSAGNSYTSPVTEFYTGASKSTGTAFFSASTSITSAAGPDVCVGAGKDYPLAKMTRHQKWWHHCWRPPDSGKLRPCSCVLRVSVYRAYWKMLVDRGVCGLECCLEPKLQAMTSQCGGIGLMSSCQMYRSVRYRVDVVPIIQKCPVHTCIPVPPVPVEMSYRTYRSVRYRY